MRRHSLDLHPNNRLADTLTEFDNTSQVILWPGVGANGEIAAVDEDENGKRPLCIFRDSNVQIQAFGGRGGEWTVW